MTSSQASIPDLFREAMRRLASTVSIISTREGELWHGMTATAVTSVSADPATILVCVNQNASLHQPLHASGRFCVNLLHADQMAVAQAFSGKLKGNARFEVGLWDDTNFHLPALQGAQANLFCTVVNTLLHGTHQVFLGHVEGVIVAGEVEPLIYQNGAYARAMAL